MVICPLLSKYDAYSDASEIACKRDECAWWDKINRACVVHRLGFIEGEVIDNE